MPFFRKTLPAPHLSERLEPFRADQTRAHAAWIFGSDFNQQKGKVVKLRKGWEITIDENLTHTVLDGSSHPFDVTFIKWAKGLPRKRVFVLK